MGRENPDQPVGETYKEALSGEKALQVADRDAISGRFKY